MMDMMKAIVTTAPRKFTRYNKRNFVLELLFKYLLENRMKMVCNGDSDFSFGNQCNS
jgi:hypothetical protein